MNENEHDEFDPHEVDHGSSSKKMSWSAFKGHTRGIVRGLVVGCTIGALVGVGVWALGAAGIVAGVGFTLAKTMAIFSVFSGGIASGLMGRIGNAAGNAAAQLAVEELKLRYPELPEISPDSPQPGVGHHLEIPADRDSGKFFHPRVGIAGAALGAAFGGLASLAGLGSLLAMHTGVVAVAPVVAPIVLGAVMGSAFGVNRSLYKTVFNFTDGLLDGNLRGPTQAEQERSRLLYRTQGDPGPAPVISNLQRQEEFYRLENGYFKRAFEAGFAGNGRGLVGGIVIGSLLGVVLGGVAVAGLALAGVTLAAGASSIVIAGVTAFTMHKSADFFSEAMFEGSGHSHVHEIYHERVRAMRKGINISFDEAEQNIVKRRQADPELTAPEAQKKVLFKPKVALIMGAIGALAGIGLAPVATKLAYVFGMGVHLEAGLAAAAFGLTGSSFGIGPRATEGLHKFADNIYHGTFNPGDLHPDIKVEGKIPLMSPRSDLAKHFSHHLQKHMPKIEYNNDVEVATQPPHHEHSHRHAVSDTTSRPIETALKRSTESFTDKVQSATPIEGVQR